MVICTFFVNGNCRFGSKCVNDHIDLKTLLKSEVEAAINGKQWLLSCFGPFKESAVLPNFIADRSFEEVRLGFLEAAKTNQQQQHINELIAQYNDAMSKMNQLKMATPDTIQLVANIYNQSLQEQKQTPQATPGSNVFGQVNTPASPPQQQQNPFQVNSIFGSSQQQQPAAMSAGSIFGGAAPTSNPFQSTGSIFGGQKEPAAPTSSFSFSLSQQQPQQSIFGASTTPQQSIFGGTVQPQQQSQQSIFGSSAQPQQQSSIFGSSSTPGASIFGGSSAFRSSTFGSAQPQPESSVFGQSSIFSQQQQQPQQQPPAQEMGIFGSVQPQMQATFPAATQNVFGQFQAQNPPVSQPQASIFSQPIAPQPQQSVFGAAQTPLIQQAPPPPPGSIFQIQQQTPAANVPQNLVNPFQQQPPKIDESAYSKPEDLTPDELNAFQADTFDINNIPLKPPPKHLCV